MVNSSLSCEVFINFAFLTFLPFGLFAAIASSAAALSCDACDACDACDTASRVGRLTRSHRRASGLSSDDDHDDSSTPTAASRAQAVSPAGYGGAGFRRPFGNSRSCFRHAHPMPVQQLVSAVGPCLVLLALQLLGRL